MTTAKVFMSGNSQAVRLPKEFRVEGDEVYIEKINGRIIITMKEKREAFKAALDDVFGCCPDFDTNRLGIKAFLTNMRIVDFTVDAAVQYAKIRADLKRTGTPIDNMDLLIAASALADGAVLVSHNTGHFSRVNGLLLEDWF